MKNRIIALVLVLSLCLSVALSLTGCGKDDKNTDKTTPDALVIMTETLDGLFNPFYSTTGADGGVVSMTQIGMITTGTDAKGDVVAAFGDDEACAVKDFQEFYDAATDTTKYVFVIKNGIKFSDGEALTIEDVLFNLYVYLDPVYTGSSTMYSTKILGLDKYRTQTNSSTDDADEEMSNDANNRARNRRLELINLFQTICKASKDNSADYETMKAAIANHNPSAGYKSAIGETDTEKARAQLLADYELALKEFREELGTDYEGSKDAYTEEPYKSSPVAFDEIVSFMYAEGFVSVEYERDPVTNKEIKNKFKKVTLNYSDIVKDKESAIQYVYDSKVSSALDQILLYWATGNELMTQFSAKAMEVILSELKKDDGSLQFPSIDGIKSLGHSTTEESVTVNGNTYKVAHEHNEDGTPKNADEYDVLSITIEGIDPKAVWNFSFAVAPQHYYAPGYEVDIPNNKFGVEFASFKFMKEVIQSTRNIQVPMGAGPYMATDKDGNSNPDGNAFFSNNVVYYKRNENFLLGAPKIEKVRYQVLSASNAIDALEAGNVHYITPQFTQNNIDRLNGLASQGIDKMYSDQLGYGYIGINAGKVPDINLRKAIMLAMDTSLALSYYSTGMAQTIYWPMSMVSWAYPKDAEGNYDRDNGHSYPAIGKFTDAKVEEIKEEIQTLMAAAGVREGDKDLDITFTIAGANLTDHPTYLTFQKAANILNECGWEIEVVSDTQALTKLSTGSLSVWAAAWGSSIDPDMYQVYHKNSTATSVLAWGYREILASPASYPEETRILNELSALIDDAREITDREERSAIYRDCMEYILDLCVELPVYQRKVLYAYNTNVIDSATLPAEVNPYTSPLDKIWEIEFAK